METGPEELRPIERDPLSKNRRTRETAYVWTVITWYGHEISKTISRVLVQLEQLYKKRLVVGYRSPLGYQDNRLETL